MHGNISILLFTKKLACYVAEHHRVAFKQCDPVERGWNRIWILILLLTDFVVLGKPPKPKGAQRDKKEIFIPFSGF